MRAIRVRACVTVGLLASLSACGGASVAPTEDGGRDGGPLADAGGPLDASAVEAGPAHDGGPPLDAGATTDAAVDRDATSLDAATHLDGGGDAEDAGSEDAAAGGPDAWSPEVGPPDAGAPDAWSPDVGPDAGRPDAWSPDVGPDAGRPDAWSPDVGLDAGAPDAWSPDVGPDAGRPDAWSPDVGPPDAGAPDAWSPDVGPPDAGRPDAWSPDAALSVCSIPLAPVVSPIDADEILSFVIASGDPIELAVLESGEPLSSAVFAPASTLALSPYLGRTVRVLARSGSARCAPLEVFDATYAVADTYPPPINQPGTTAIARTDPRFVAWATGHASVTYGTDVADMWRTPHLAYGPAGTSVYEIVCLGNGGNIVLTFGAPITNGPGPDFAVFENSFNDTFLELAHVEVSSNGVDFVRFDSAYRGAMPVGGFGAHSPTLFGGLASSFAVGYGTPFDLETLANQPDARAGVVDLSRITHVRIRDIVGAGAARDSWGRSIYDPTPTVGSGGFDLDAIGVIHQRP